MADFEDEFTDTPGTDLASHTPTVGTGWTQTEGFANELQIDTAGTGLQVNSPANRAVYVSDDLGQADLQIWFQVKQDGAFRVNVAAVRIQDNDNWIGGRMFGGGGAGWRLAKEVAGTITDLISTGSSVDQWWRITAEGTTIKLWDGGTGAEPSDPTEDTNWTQIGGDQTVSEFSTETTQGFMGSIGNAADPMWDNYRAHKIGAPAAGFTPFPVSQRTFRNAILVR